MSSKKGILNSDLNGYVIYGGYEKTKLTGIELRKFLLDKIKMMPNEEPYVCATFGCGRKLSLNEQLYGKYCFQCCGQDKFDINTVIKPNKAKFTQKRRA